MRAAVRALLVAIGVGGIVFLFLLPARTWLEQSHAMSVAERRFAVLSRENTALSERVKQLQRTSYIEQIARDQYGLVMPGQKAFAILLPEATTTTVPPNVSSAGHTGR